MNKIWVLIFIVILLSCSKMSPISGLYQTKDGRLSANVLDSTLFLMIGLDTMIIYDLKIHYELKEDSNTFRLYKVVFSNSLNRRGYKLFEIPLQLEADLLLGGTLTTWFENDDSFIIGGYYFQRQQTKKARKYLIIGVTCILGTQKLN